MIFTAVASGLFATRLADSANPGDDFDQEKGSRTQNGALPIGNDANNDREGEYGFDEGPDDVLRDEEGEIDEIIPNVDYPQPDDGDDEANAEYPPQPKRGRMGRVLYRTSSFFSVSDFSPSFWTRLKSTINSPSTTDLDESHFPHYRLTPILSGVLIPFSILLEIPGVTENWYIRTGEGNKTIETRDNTPILEAGIAISLVCAVVANVFLVMRFLEYKVLHTTALCITFLTLHGTSPSRFPYSQKRSIRGLVRYYQHHCGHYFWC
jgi:hypothetical protein